MERSRLVLAGLLQLLAVLYAVWFYGDRQYTLALLVFALPPILLMIGASTPDSARWVVGEHFLGDWLPEDIPRAPLPVALNMGALYERLLTPLVEGQTARLVAGMGEAPQTPFTPAEPDRPVSLDERIAQAEAIKAQTREVERIKARLGREKQFNKRVAINAELRAAKQELERLTGAHPGAAVTND